MCVHVCLCVRLCLVPCDLRRSEIYLQCLCGCRPVRVSRGAMGDMVRAACGRRRPPVFHVPCVAHVSLRWVLSACLMLVCVRARDVVPVSVPLGPR